MDSGVASDRAASVQAVVRAVALCGWALVAGGCATGHRSGDIDTDREGFGAAYVNQQKTRPSEKYYPSGPENSATTCWINPGHIHAPEVTYLRVAWSGSCDNQRKLADGYGVMRMIGARADGSLSSIRLLSGTWNHGDFRGYPWPFELLPPKELESRDEPVRITGPEDGMPLTDAGLLFFRSFYPGAVFLPDHERFSAFRKRWNKANPGAGESLFNAFVATATALRPLTDAALAVGAVKASQARERTIQKDLNYQEKVQASEYSAGRYDSKAAVDPSAARSSLRRELDRQKDNTRLSQRTLASSDTMDRTNESMRAALRSRVAGAPAPDGADCLVGLDEQSGRKRSIEATWLPSRNACADVTLVKWRCRFSGNRTDGTVHAERCAMDATVQPGGTTHVYNSLGKPERSLYAETVCVKGSTPDDVESYWKDGFPGITIYVCKWD